MPTRATRKTPKRKTVGGAKTPLRKASRKASAGRQPRSAFMKPLTPSLELAQVVGSDPLPRTEVVKKVWAYIKKHGLQDRRNINADDNLKPVFGGKRTVTMFEMTSLINKHLS
jgi:upstream activation factor subunit UAF30